MTSHSTPAVLRAGQLKGHLKLSWVVMAEGRQAQALRCSWRSETRLAVQSALTLRIGRLRACTHLTAQQLLASCAVCIANLRGCKT